MVGDEREESHEGGSSSMGVTRVVVSSGDANLSCEIGELGEACDSESNGLAALPSSLEANRSSDKVV